LDFSCENMKNSEKRSNSYGTDEIIEEPSWSGSMAEGVWWDDAIDYITCIVISLWWMGIE